MDADLIRAAALAATMAASTASLAADPTRPPAEFAPAPRPVAAGAAQAAVPELHLQAVMRHEGKPPGAMINGWVLRPGDTMHGVRLAAVGDTHADVVVAGERIRLSLTPSIQRKSSPPAVQASAGRTGDENPKRTP